jgi:hypothetical protein
LLARFIIRSILPNGFKELRNLELFLREKKWRAGGSDNEMTKRIGKKKQKSRELLSCSRLFCFPIAGQSV